MLGIVRLVKIVVRSVRAYFRIESHGMAANRHMFKISNSKKSDCSTCFLKNSCLFRNLFVLPNSLSGLDVFTKPPATLKKREPLIMQGMALNSLFIVRSGSLKQVVLAGQGERIVTGFFLPGDVVGLDSIARKHYSGSVLAMEKSSVCELPFDQVDMLGVRYNELRNRLYVSLIHEIDEERLMLRLMLRKTAEARLAFFFVRLSDRFRQRGFSSQRISLPMSRGDIGNYLGLSEETVSRILSRYQLQNLMSIKGREVHILDLEQLAMLSEATGRRDSNLDS